MVMIYDVVRYKLHRMKKEMKDELEDKDNVQEYGCHNCKRKYSALDVLRLLSMQDDSFHCENCNHELVMECNKRTSQEVQVLVVVDGSDNARRWRDQLKDLLQNMEVRLKPLIDHINRIKDLPVPSFESFPVWEARAAKSARENGDLNPDDTLRSQGGYGSTPRPFLGETEIEVNLGEGKEEVKSDEGEASELSDDKKSTMGNGDDDKDLKANQQPRTDIELATTSSDRQVGMKCKREEEDEEDVAWEETFNVSANGNYKVDMNVEAEKAEERGF
ncbi:unnamed protein product [Arabidopsis arenosa]|uniref:Transcription initiation factor IIE subunit alpha N-terminal domain-containing protein n=1 Tax=Arabidopsis arenosa TaxID=38785 RepID=A0A8S2AX62_ARAAE|nr:unnamed protein product [Arabidopsis arenosa]